MKKVLISLVFIGFTMISVLAQENPKWIRKNCISPDGTKIAFSYKGDIYVIGINGGKPIQITSNPGYDNNPLWTKDGKNIIFESDRNGSMDIFMTTSEGGKPKAITDYAGNEIPLTILPNGDILFTYNSQPDLKYDGFPSYPQIYRVSPKGGKPILYTSLPISNISVNKNYQAIYEDYKGYEDDFRKHHTSSVTRDIWLYNPTNNKINIDGTGNFTKLTSFKGEDREPIFAHDGKTFYYISEQGGKTLNIYKSSIDNPGKPIQLTFESKNPIRYISISDNGILAYSYNGDLYTLKEGQKPHKVEMTIMRDQDEKDTDNKELMSGATEIAISPNGKETALILRGDVFVTSNDYKTTKRITNTPQQERNLSFSNDGKTLYYSSERNGNWGIYRTTLANDKEKFFTYATKLKEELFSKKGETAFQPLVSPDGKWVAYLRNRTELVIENTTTKKIKSLVKDVNYSYQDGDLSFAWSPDSKYLLTNDMQDGGWNHNDIGLVNINDGKLINLTQSGYSDGNFKWALGGKAITWESDKDGYRSHGSWGATEDIYIMFFDGKTMSKFFKDKEDTEIDDILCSESKDKEKKDKKKTENNSKKNKKEDKKKEVKKEVKKDSTLKLDLVNRAQRIFRLTPSTGELGDYYLNNDGTKLYYITYIQDNYALCMIDLKKDDIKVLKSNVNGRIIPSKNGKTIYVLSKGHIYSFNLNSGETKNIEYSANFTYNPKAEREYIFNHIWKQVKEKFYDPKIHNVDWEYYKKNYAQFLPYINNNYDFAEMLSEMLGELNASHTGARYFHNNKVQPSYLGIFEDPDYHGDGIRIKEIFLDGPINLADSDIKPGDLILSINGKEIKKGDNWRDWLKNKATKKLLITVKKDNKTKEIVVSPIYSIRDDLYKRWIKQREDRVKELSNGKIGYVHVRGMNSDSFRKVYSKALGKYRNCDALIVDTRYNGGGWLHDDLATLLSGKAYINYCPRGQFISYDPYNKWCKPSCVLVSESNYSDASGFPYIYQTLKIGKLIGAPVPGTMTAVWWERQIDPTIVFGIPQVGAIGLKENQYLENHQIEPDILIYNDPKSLLNGDDKQLERAVNEMLKTIKK